MSANDIVKLASEVGGLKTAIEMMMEMWKSQEANATAGRKALHEKVEMVRQEVGVELASVSLRVERLGFQVETATKKIEEIEPSVTAFKEEKLMQKGAQRLGVKLYGAMMVAAGAVGWAIHEFIAPLFSLPHK